MLGNAVVDYIVRECKENYGLDRAELIEENKKKKKFEISFSTK